ncbi:MAG: SpoIID/LytB domain-containing protein [Pyrinomonadaceae bacterium]
MKLRKIAFFAIALLNSILFAAGSFGQDVSPEESAVLEEEFIDSRAKTGESHASGSREDLGPVIMGNPTQSVFTIRVGLHYSFTSTGTYSEFTSLNHPTVQVANTEGTAFIIDQSTGQQIASITAGQIVEVSYTNAAGYLVTTPAGPFTVVGPIRLQAELPTNQFRIESIRRSNPLVGGSPQTVPLYRGSIEVSRSTATAADRVNLVNIIEVESYVRGVVANESIASFHMEALKTQATAARGYAVANISNYVNRGYPFDIVDSSASQVYRGVISEHARAVQATEESRGIVASYNGRIISALYSSSFGGYSDSNHWIFNLGGLPGTNVTPYLTGIYDGEGPAPDLTTDAGRQAFWTTANQAFSYDMCGRVGNRFARWQITIPASDIKARLTAGRYVLINGDITGNITGIEVLQRMTGSNRIASIRITLTTGVVEVRGWDNLRNVIGRSRSAGTSPVAPCTGTAIAANFTLTNPAMIQTTSNPDGTLAEVISTGGGWGHNVGMSQYGSHGRGLAGQTFLQILQTYYQGVDVGTYPITVTGTSDAGTPNLSQTFYTSTGQATLVIRAMPDLKRFEVRVNGYSIPVRGSQLLSGKYARDISPYLVPGLNTVVYIPNGRHREATFNVNLY